VLRCLVPLPVPGLCIYVRVGVSFDNPLTDRSLFSSTGWFEDILSERIDERWALGRCIQVGAAYPSTQPSLPYKHKTRTQLSICTFWVAQIDDER